jgi:hypothetical protein
MKVQHEESLAQLESKLSPAYYTSEGRSIDWHQASRRKVRSGVRATPFCNKPRLIWNNIVSLIHVRPAPRRHILEESIKELKRISRKQRAAQSWKHNSRDQERADAREDEWKKDSIRCNVFGIRGIDP